MLQFQAHEPKTEWDLWTETFKEMQSVAKLMVEEMGFAIMDR